MVSRDVRIGIFGTNREEQVEVSGDRDARVPLLRKGRPDQRSRRALTSWQVEVSRLEKPRCYTSSAGDPQRPVSVSLSV